MVLAMANKKKFECKYCGVIARTFRGGHWVPITGPLQAEIWAGYHVKVRHKRIIKSLAKKRAKWSAIFKRA